MVRMWIVVGDPTSSGGRVVTGSPYTDIEGAPVARVGDKAVCPLHKGAFPIVDGHPTIDIDGQPVALDGSRLACGCSVTTQRQSRTYVDQGGGAAAESPAPASVPLFAPLLADKPPVCLECLLSGAATGAPLLGRA
ncbi:PAAR domain-containing protein [Xanthomonas translucens]|uniref:PAAR domain-containing protein n=2 Tax=Xanthomonas campestris pv. translucens TaxID=343 RepID=UPI00073B4D76|nr:PAAR domain-containing protein [Xanthomonas translucens]KTF36859.1 PAAR motif family protein [Xanthomonas translucens pv. translucens]